MKNDGLSVKNEVFFCYNIIISTSYLDKTPIKLKNGL